VAARARRGDVLELGDPLDERLDVQRRRAPLRALLAAAQALLRSSAP
jgi:hypothetical protein